MGNNENKGDSKIINPLIQKFKFPYAIKSDGGITYCFKDISAKDIFIQSREEYFLDKVQSHENNSSIGNLEIENDLQINFLLNDHKFKHQANNIKSEEKKYDYLLGKYILYYINIKPDNIKFSKHYKDQISDIIKHYHDDKERFKNLDELFQNIGFYVPLQIEIGAKFYTHETESYKKGAGNFATESDLKGAFEEVIKEKNKYKSQYKNEYGNSLRREGKNIIGGNPHLENFEEWKNSVTIDNAVVIGYKNLQHIKQFVDIAIRKKLSDPFIKIENKYEARKLFMENIEHLKKLPEIEFKNRKGTFERGICETSTIPKIIVIDYDLRDNSNKIPIKNNTPVNKSFSKDIIVGWRIEDLWKDGTNGTWSLIKDPLLSNDLNASFISKPYRGQHFKIFVYLMHIPD